MIRKLLLIPYNIWAQFCFWIYIAVCFFYTHLVILLFRERAHVHYYRMFYYGARAWSFLTRIRVEVQNMHYRSPDKTYVMIANHSSTLDLIPVVIALKYGFKVLGKQEVVSFPLLGYLISEVGVLVDRSSPESRHMSYGKMKNVLKDSFSIFIMPEGTRNRTEHALTEFHDGAFRLAIETQTPLLPMVVLFCRRLMPMNSWLMRPGLIQCVYLPPVDVSGMTSDDVPALKTKVFGMMESMILEREFGEKLRD